MEELRQKLLEAENRAREAQQDRDRERQRAEDSQKRAEDAQKRAEDAQKRAEDAQKHAEDAQKHAEDAQKRANELEEYSRQTTFDEYIALCHTLLFSSLRVQQDPKFTTKGSITNPKDKLCPTSLQVWPGFLEQQMDVFNTLYECSPLDARVYDSHPVLISQSRRVARQPIGSEKTLEYFMHNCIEDPTRDLVEQLQKIEAVRGAFEIGDGIVFENHPHAISEVAEEVAERPTSTPPQTPDQTRDLNQLRPDQICVYRSSNGERKMVYVTEYKAPHKLTVSSLRAGLRPMNIYDEVVNRAMIPPSEDTDARFVYNAERLAASALTQTYHYMIEGGLEYGLMTTGEATVFLKVDWAEPGTLYYHLAEPGPEVSAHPEHVQSSSAVGQHLAFTLMALGKPGAQMNHSQDERDRVADGLQRWAVDFYVLLRSIPESERAKSESDRSWAPTTYESFDRSPAVRKRRRRRSSIGDSGRRPAGRRDEPSSGDEAAPPPPSTPSPLSRRNEDRQKETRRSERALTSRPRKAAEEEQYPTRQPQEVVEKDSERQYCTQKCLLGLVQGSELDPNCPNLRRHTQGRSGGWSHHLIGHATWLQLLTQQLRRTLDAGVVKLDINGARGVLFKVTLLDYGYTVVCKGTVRAFIRDLEHEAAMYRRLERLQGTHVPVFLGAIDLRPLKRTYYYDHRVYVVHMSFMSWGGEQIDKGKLAGSGAMVIGSKAVASLRAIHAEGVVHNDVRLANMLVNPETGTVMMIDFERSLWRRQRYEPARTAACKRAEALSMEGEAGRKRQRTEYGRARWDLHSVQVLFGSSVVE
ncbi:Conserved hypothetical, protein [Geosmithia morbida]|uniref:EKC/KEOPS complex subunit BUD32 n=1 Tax=Geosmithia morbida TaxID=1094350 RepID=A0A9P4YWT5_9HYPO|nr:Conserved hypothetical, protein [Geosmithia morbida]KAF4123118.1 Conserved hypothetical, protein [Geosmithia morbida]